MNWWKCILLFIVFIFIFGIIVFFYELRFGKWIDNEVYEFIYLFESFIIIFIMLGVIKIGEVWVMVVLFLLLVVYFMLKCFKIEILFFVIVMSLFSIFNLLLKNIFDRECLILLCLIDILGFSFLSGYVMGLILFFGSVIYVINCYDLGIFKGVLIGLCVFFILLILIFRVYLGVYYFIDIIVGIIGGVFCIVLLMLILKK